MSYAHLLIPRFNDLSPACARYAWARSRALAFPGSGGCTEFCRTVYVAGACSFMLQSAKTDGSQNTSSHFTRSERISLAQGAIDQIITHSFPSGTMEKVMSQPDVANTTSMTTYFNMLWIISAIARKDLVSGTQDNKAYVDGELGALIRNDTW
jgi:hypothetical protein